MSVRALLTPGASGSLERIDVEGTTYDPEQGRLINFPGLNSAFVLVSKVCALCNSSGIVKDGNVIKPYGSPTEAALKVSLQYERHSDLVATEQHLLPLDL